MTIRLGALFAALLTCSVPACGSGGHEGPPPVESSAPPGRYPDEYPRPRFETLRIDVEGHPLLVEVADTAAKRAYGLMFVTELPDDRGMLFVLPEPRPQAFWMRNTLIALDIAFLADIDGEVRVVNVHENTEPLRESPPYRSAGACRYALEVRGGWFADRGLGPGARVRPAEVLRALRAGPDEPWRPEIPPLPVGPERGEGG